MNGVNDNNEIYLLLGTLDGKVSSILTTLLQTNNRLDEHNVDIKNLDVRVSAIEAAGNTSKNWLVYLVSAGSFLVSIIPWMEKLIK